ncbi:MAG: bifunctional demethylmenaquinone methyltransferase/2-methoxy-6-polyprenyl-1,4-benzoquinol methylase UbiE [Fimbriimonadales bacterium]
MAHPTAEKPWTAEGAAKREAVRDMFAGIAPKYDLMNGLMSLSLHHRWRKAAVAMLDLHPGDKALDVCCGTGDFMVPLFESVGETGFVGGVDFCLPMLAQAQSKLGTHRISLGDACRLPFQSGTMDAVSVGWGIRNVPDIDQAHAEAYRVLRPGGRFVSLDMAKPRNPILRWLSTLLFKTVVPWLGGVLSSKKAYAYLPESTQRFWSRAELTSSLERAGFVDCGYRDLFFGNICIHYGRKK